MRPACPSPKNLLHLNNSQNKCSYLCAEHLPMRNLLNRRKITFTILVYIAIKRESVRICNSCCCCWKLAQYNWEIFCDLHWIRSRRRWDSRAMWKLLVERVLRELNKMARGKQSNFYSACQIHIQQHIGIWRILSHWFSLLFTQFSLTFLAASQSATPICWGSIQREKGGAVVRFVNKLWSGRTGGCILRLAAKFTRRVT